MPREEATYFCVALPFSSRLVYKVGYIDGVHAKGSHEYFLYCYSTSLVKEHNMQVTLISHLLEKAFTHG